MTYYMNCERNNEIGYWEECNATTLAGAKRVATRRYSQDQDQDETLLIATVYYMDGPVPLASKPNRAGAKWTNQ